MKGFIHPIAQMAVELRPTTFHDRRTVELHNRYDQVQRDRFRLRVEANEKRRSAATSTEDTTPPFLRRQAL